MRFVYKNAQFFETFTYFKIVVVKVGYSQRIYTLTEEEKEICVTAISPGIEAQFSINTTVLFENMFSKYILLVPCCFRIYCCLINELFFLRFI